MVAMAALMPANQPLVVRLHAGMETLSLLIDPWISLESLFYHEFDWNWSFFVGVDLVLFSKLKLN